LDEPTAACDVETAIQVENAIIACGLSVIIISHDLQQIGIVILIFIYYLFNIYFYIFYY
jgi:ATPase subunit of ABC transporter with duplicated ATPase domains